MESCIHHRVVTLLGFSIFMASALRSVLALSAPLEVVNPRNPLMTFNLERLSL
jgi:hypothetical protein